MSSGLHVTKNTKSRTGEGIDPALHAVAGGEEGEGDPGTVEAE